MTAAAFFVRFPARARRSRALSGGAGAGRRGEFLAGLPAISFCWNGRGVGRYGVRFARRGAATSPAGATEVRALGFFGRCGRPIARSLNLLMKGDRGRLLRAFSRAREAEPGALGGAGAGRRGELRPAAGDFFLLEWPRGREVRGPLREEGSSNITGGGYEGARSRLLWLAAKRPLALSLIC